MATIFFDSNMATGSAVAVTTKWARKDDWTTYQAVIRNLYEKHTLTEVMKTMEAQYGFKATPKMYKTHIKQWGLDKKNKENEMRAVMRKTASRVSKGKDSEFYIRGKTVNFENVVRYCQRKGVTIDEMIAQREASKTPEAVECFSPVLSPSRSLGDLASEERLLIAVRDYQQLSLQFGAGCSSVLTDLHTLVDQSNLACRLFARQAFLQAGQAMMKAMTGIQKIVQGKNPYTMGYLLWTIHEILFYGNIEVATSLLRQLAAMSDQCLPKDHPFGVIWSRLALMLLSDPGHYSHVHHLSMRVNVECVEKLLGPLHANTIEAKLGILDVYGGTRHHKQQELGLKSLLRECELALGPNYDLTMNVGMDLACCYLTHDNPIEAKRIAYALCDLTKSDLLQVRSLHVLGISQHALGEMVAAETFLRKAIDLGITLWGCHDGEVHWLMLILETCLAEQGKLDSVAQLRDERLRYWEPVELL